MTARRVIVTVSTGVLRRGLETGALDMPQLPDAYKAAIANLPMAMLAKIAISVEGLAAAFAREGVGAFGSLLDQGYGADSLWFLCVPWNLDLVVGFAGGDLGWRLCEGGGEPARRAAIERQAADYAQQRLVNLFGHGAKGAYGAGVAPAKYLLTPWAWDENALGAYSAALLGHFCYRATLRQPVENRIFFAGEALAIGDQYEHADAAACRRKNAPPERPQKESFVATCHGAFATGETAAREIVAALRR